MTASPQPVRSPEAASQPKSDDQAADDSRDKASSGWRARRSAIPIQEAATKNTTTDARISLKCYEIIHVSQKPFG